MLKLLAALGKAGVAANVIEPIAAPLGKLYALPDDKVALKQLFDALAAFASPPSQHSGRWWAWTKRRSRD